MASSKLVEMRPEVSLEVIVSCPSLYPLSNRITTFEILLPSGSAIEPNVFIAIPAAAPSTKVWEAEPPDNSGASFTSISVMSFETLILSSPASSFTVTSTVRFWPTRLLDVVWNFILVNKAETFAAVMLAPE